MRQALPEKPLWSGRNIVFQVLGIDPDGNKSNMGYFETEEAAEDSVRKLHSLLPSTPNSTPKLYDIKKVSREEATGT